MTSLRHIQSSINIRGSVRIDEPMSRHTTFELGGPADVYARPADASDVAALLAWSRSQSMPAFVLGGGANILVSDAGIRGLVVDLSDINGFSVHGTRVRVGAGLPVSRASERAAEAALGGLDFLYSMPGSTGGAVWMNARCYGSSVEDILVSARLISEEGTPEHYRMNHEDFAYKVSPFQTRHAVIVECEFELYQADRDELFSRMAGYEEDRRSKGHFSAPSAGSVFKNDRRFGQPSGVIIDGLGLRGTQCGAAKVSDNHANIFVNTGGATASDMRTLIEYVADRVEAERGFRLEREVLYVGDWSGWDPTSQPEPTPHQGHE